MREESPTCISTLSSCTPTPALSREASDIQGDTKNQSENSVPPSKQLNYEYRLSNRKFRQLSPLEQKPTGDSSLTVDNTTEGFINHAYSTESLYNQLPNADSVLTSPLPITASDSILPPQLTTTDSIPYAPTSSTTTTSSPIPPQTILESFRHMCSLIFKLMKNTRFVFIIIANLFEGILIKGKPSILFYLIEINFI
jgi:hypothetical protein